MPQKVDLSTARLTLRRWSEADLAPFVHMNADPEVMRYFPDTLSAQQTKNFFDAIQKEFAQYGYGLYAVGEKGGSDFIGFIGFHWARMDVDFCPCIEIGWRLQKHCWGRGYATEGARACLQHGFEVLGFQRVYSFTAAENATSQRVMQKLGMRLHRYFEHPGIPQGHPQKPHVCFCAETYMG